MYISCCVRDWDSFPFQYHCFLLKLHVHHTNCFFEVQNYLCTRDEELKLITQIQHINNSKCNNFIKSKWVRAKVHHKRCSIHRIWVKLMHIRNPISVQFQEFCCSSVPSAFIQVKHMYRCCISAVTTPKLGNVYRDNGLIFKSHISMH